MDFNANIPENASDLENLNGMSGSGNEADDNPNSNANDDPSFNDNLTPALPAVQATLGIEIGGDFVPLVDGQEVVTAYSYGPPSCYLPVVLRITGLPESLLNQIVDMSLSVIAAGTGAQLAVDSMTIGLVQALEGEPGTYVLRRSISLDYDLLEASVGDAVCVLVSFSYDDLGVTVAVSQDVSLFLVECF